MVEDENIQQSLNILERIKNDESIPKNIRRASDRAMDALRDDSMDTVVRISSALNHLEDVINDPNIPVHARTQIWNVTSQLETVTAE